MLAGEMGGLNPRGGFGASPAGSWLGTEPREEPPKPRTHLGEPLSPTPAASALLMWRHGGN